MTYAFNPSGQWTYQHLMSVNGSFGEITRDDLLVVADRFQVPHRFDVISEVSDAVAQWAGFADQAGISTADVERIRETFPSM